MMGARAIAFRALAPDDLAQVFAWLSSPHVSRWYAPSPGSFAEVLAKYGPRTEPGNAVRAFVFQVDGRDAGYIQFYALHDFPEYAALVGSDAGDMGMDLFIGEESLVGWGLGPRVARKFADEIVFAGNRAGACLAGPAEGDLASVRAFEKAGFRRWKVVRPQDGPAECVMRAEAAWVRRAFEPIDIARDFDSCIAFRTDAYVLTFGSLDGIEKLMGADNCAYRKQLQEQAAQVPEGNSHLWREGRIVGQTEMRLVESDPRVGYVNLFYIVPQCRGIGLGRLLHEHAVSVFRRRGMRLLRLSVSHQNAAANAFYRKIGWVPVGPRSHQVPMEILEYAFA